MEGSVPVSLVAVLSCRDFSFLSFSLTLVLSGTAGVRTLLVVGTVLSLRDISSSAGLKPHSSGWCGSVGQ